MIRRAIEAGFTWVDTAPTYGDGDPEEIVGRELMPFRAGEDRSAGGAAVRKGSIQAENRRWLCMYVTKGNAVTLLKVQLAASALAELRARDGQNAAQLLGELVR